MLGYCGGGDFFFANLGVARLFSLIFLLKYSSPLLSLAKIINFVTRYEIRIR